MLFNSSNSHIQWILIFRISFVCNYSVNPWTFFFFFFLLFSNSLFFGRFFVSFKYLWNFGGSYQMLWMYEIWAICIKFDQIKLIFLLGNSSLNAVLFTRIKIVTNTHVEMWEFYLFLTGWGSGWWGLIFLWY